MSDRDALLQIISIASQALAGEPIVPPIPTTPVPLPPAHNNPYPGPNLWLYPGRLNTGDLPKDGSAVGGFTVPPGWAGTVEIAISGANLKVFIDHEEYTGPYTPGPGEHRLAVFATAVASGSIDVHHTP